MCKPCPDPLNSVFQPDTVFGALSDNLYSLMESIMPDGKKKEAKSVQNMLKLKAMRSLCVPGEPVGLLAAQVNNNNNALS